jgi:hypothetical protein
MRNEVKKLNRKKNENEVKELNYKELCQRQTTKKGKKNHSIFKYKIIVDACSQHFLYTFRSSFKLDISALSQK